MSREIREFSAKTVEDAITKACTDMEVPSDRLEIRVMSEGSSGFLGFGSKPAVIQVCLKEDEQKEFELPPLPEDSREKTESRKSSKPRKHAKPAAEKPQEPESRKEADEEAPKAKPEKPAVERTQEEIVMMKAAASKFLDSMFQAMEMPVSITIDYDKEADCLGVDLEGAEMGILIGKRGQTLDSLQYLTSLVVNRDQKNYVRVKLDTEDYRKRRKETLENLAKNIAYRVKRTHKPVSLEAMNPYERRIIHSALQGNKFVETYSEGNEPYRHVVVAPKKD